MVSRIIYVQTKSSQTGDSLEGSIEKNFSTFLYNMHRAFRSGLLHILEDRNHRNYVPGS